VIIGIYEIQFRNIHLDGSVQTPIDAILRIVGDFAVWVGNRQLYHEVEFCLVEFAVVIWHSQRRDTSCRNPVAPNETGLRKMIG
jgi:hypothetical protein